MRRAVSLGLFVLCACGGPALHGQVFEHGQVRYRIGELPARWRRLDSEGDLAFFDRDRAAIISVHSRCDVHEDDVPLVSLTAHLLIGFTEREIASQDVVPFDGREALRTVVTARLDGVPRRMTLYVLKKNGCVYDLLYAAPPDEHTSGAGEFERFVRGFATERP